MTCLYKLKSCSGHVGWSVGVTTEENDGGGGVPTLKTERQESRASVSGHRPGQTLRQNQVTLSHIHLSASVRLPAPAQRELSSGPCRGISRSRVERKRGAAGAREREGESLNAISRGWKRSALRRSLMYGLIWAATVLRACSIGREFAKLMAHIKPQRKFASRRLSTVGESKSPYPCTSGHSFQNAVIICQAAVSRT